MSEVLTSVQEPGFFSEVSESPSLSLPPTVVSMVGLIGTGSATKTVTQAVTSGNTGYSDALGSPVTSVNAISSNAIRDGCKRIC